MRKKLENLIKKRLQATKKCEFKKAFLPKDFTIVKINTFAKELAKSIINMENNLRSNK